MSTTKATLSVCFSAFVAVCFEPVATAEEGIIFPLEILQNWQVDEQEFRSGPYRVRMWEFVPAGQSLNKWTQMITFMAVDMQGARERVTGQSEFAEGTAHYRQVCGKTAFSKPRTSTEDGRKVTVFSLACDRAASGPTAGSGDYTYVKVIEAGMNVFIAQRAWRGDLPDPTVRPISDDEYRRWLDFFDGVGVP